MKISLDKNLENPNFEKSKEISLRCFIAIDLSRECRQEIKKIQDLLKKNNLFLGRFTEPENLHLTLKFLGGISEEQILEVKKRLNEIKMPELHCEIGEIGVFSKSLAKIIWVRLNGKGIFELQKQIDQKLLGLFEKEKRFMSHITIARVKNVPDKPSFFEYFRSIRPKPIKFSVKSFVLKKSELFLEGPTYTDLEEFYFG
ncbi:MAG: RNA 2',3'-cyclic phosphodiesterase [Candidatus Pacearchaeota archaeon]|jgi:2'-5' RNA ligase